MEIAIALYDGVTALDAVGPYEPLSRMPGWTTKFVAAEAGPKMSDTQSLALVAAYSVEDLPSPDIVVIPGGEGSRRESGEAIQLSIEYDPQPPVDAGSPAKAPEQIVELVRSLAIRRESD